jgi:hypothetical protein
MEFLNAPATETMVELVLGGRMLRTANPLPTFPLSFRSGAPLFSGIVVKL